MANSFKLDDRAFDFFAAEAPELLQILESGLLNLSADSTTAEVHEMMRAAHSIKGGAASVGLDTIKTLAHRLEDFLKALYSEAASIDDDVKTLLLHSFDCLRDPLQSLFDTGSFDEEEALATAQPYFETLELVLGDALAASQNFIPSSEDLGVDIAGSIFEVDVAEGIERLKSVLASPHDFEVAGELRTQLEVFSGFSELLNLKGFGKICSTAQQALEHNPSQAIEIIALAVVDFEAGRTAVLNGDRAEGGSPSSDLQAMAAGTAAANTAATTPEPATQNGSSNGTVEDNTVLDELFGPSELDLLAGVDSQELDSSDQIADVFGSSLVDETANTEINSDADSIYAFADSSETDTAVEDVFGAFVSDAEDSLASESENLQDVFGSVSDSSAESVFGETDLAATEDTVGDGATVDDIFGVVELDETPTDTQPELATTSLPEAGPQVQQVFAQVVQESAGTTEIAAKSEKTPAKKAAAKVVRPTVRVEIERLDRMGNQMGELSIMQNSLTLQQTQLQRAIKELQRRTTLFKDYIKQLGSLADEIVIAPEQFGRNGNGATSTPIPVEPRSNENSQWQDAGFDALEMDRYSSLYSSLQTLLEESALLEEASDDVVLYSRQATLTLNRQEKQLQQLQDELTWARMLPLKNVLQRFPRTVHEMSRKFSKRVNLVLDGTWVLVDKSVLDKIYDPLLHLLRNAFDHGIEPPDTRQSLGKPEEGTITIRSYYQGSETIIEMIDDGRGIDPSTVRQKAVSKGLLTADQAQSVSDDRVVDCLFEPGFSTAESVSELSGRGIGLDVVRVQLRELKGKVGITSTPGEGTTFTLRLPFTLTMTKLLVCTINSSAVALSSDNIEEIYVPSPDALHEEGDRRYITWRENVVPIYPLSQLLEYSCPVLPLPDSKSLQPIDTPENWASPVLVVKQGIKYIALEVDRLIAEQELAIKPLGAAISPPEYIYGCTVLADGTLVPVFDAIALLEVKGDNLNDSSAHASGYGSEAPTVFPQRQVTTILVVDDSVAQRRSLNQSCQRAGYRVLQAGNGQEALYQLEQNSRVDAIICDIEMPKMNGFEFLTIRRQTKAFASIPVAMLTSRSSQKHQQLALQLGASAYLNKPYLEQELLAVLKDMCEAKASATK